VLALCDRSTHRCGGGASDGDVSTASGGRSAEGILDRGHDRQVTTAGKQGLPCEAMTGVSLWGESASLALFFGRGGQP
jgi:hypothetical protein